MSKPTTSADYQRGYAAGKRKSIVENTRLTGERKTAIENIQTQEERVFLRCLDMVMKHCRGWTINDVTINNAEGYCKLASIFAKNGIS